MDATTKGAVIGAAATAFGGLVTWVGARAQANAALRAVHIQVRGQRFDAQQEVRRAAYASFFGSVERAWHAVAHTSATRTVALTYPDDAPPDGNSEAQAQLRDALKELWFQQALLRLAVAGQESRAADTLVDQVSAAADSMSEWTTAAMAGSEDEQDLLDAHRRQMTDLRAAIMRVIEEARGWLDAAPEVEVREEGYLLRVRSWFRNRRAR